MDFDLSRYWWVLVLRGLAAILFGILAFLWPGLTLLVLVLFFGAYAFVDGVLAIAAALFGRDRAGPWWALLTGVFEVMMANRLREYIEGEWLLALSGVLSVLFGFALIVMPAAGALAVVWLIGAYALIFGVLLLMLGFRLRGWGQRVSTRAGF